MKDKSNNDNKYGSMNHDSADASADANADVDAVFPFSSSNLLPSSRMYMIVSTIVPLQRSSSTTSTASTSTSTSTSTSISTSTSNDDANTSITNTNNMSFMNDSSFVVYGSNNRKERTTLLPSSSVPVPVATAAAAAAHSSSTSSSSSSGNDAVIKSNDWTNMHIYLTEYIKSVFRSMTEYGGNNDTDNVDDVDDDCSYCRKHLY